MAELIDEVLEEEKVEASSLEEMGSEEPEVEAKEETKPEDDLPEKYKGKSLKDIVLMHQEAEKLIGRQGSEVGELRKVVDDFIKTQTSKDSDTKETEVNDYDFFYRT